MPDSNPIMNIFSNPDESWEEAVARMTPEEGAAYLRHLYEMFKSDREKWSMMPDELVEQIGRNADKLEAANRECDLANRRAAEALAKKKQIEATYDAILADPWKNETEQ